MSRGPGRWQRALIQAADGALVATTYGVVKATLAAPYRNDFTTARRGARGLALKQRLTAGLRVELHAVPADPGSR